MNNTQDEYKGVDPEIFDKPFFYGFDKKGNKRIVYLCRDEDRIKRVSTGYIDEESCFFLFYGDTTEFVEENKPGVTIKHEHVADIELPWIIYNMRGSVGIELLDPKKHTFTIDDPDDPEELIKYKIENPFKMRGMGIPKETVLSLIKDPKVFDDLNLDLLYLDLKEFLKKYSWFPDDDLYDLETLYVIATYFHQGFKCFPIFAIRGPVGCGKTRTNLVMYSVSYNAIATPDLSSASFYHMRKAWHNTICLDERTIQDKREQDILEYLVSSAYKKGGSVLRMSEVPPRIPKDFPLFGPLIYSSVREMPYATITRAIEIMMQVTNQLKFSDLPEPEREDTIPTELRNRLFLAVLKFGSAVCKKYNSISNEEYQIANRDWELYKPFIALAEFIDVCDIEVLKNIIKVHIKRREAEKVENIDYQILLVLKLFVDGYFDEGVVETPQTKLTSVMADETDPDLVWIYLKDVADKVCELFQHDDSWCNSRKIGKVLRDRFNLKEGKPKRRKDGTLYQVDTKKVNGWVIRAQLTKDLNMLMGKEEEPEEENNKKEENNELRARKVGEADEVGEDTITGEDT